jgi:integrase/recombinase XerD
VTAHAIEARPVWTPHIADPSVLLLAGFQAGYRGHTANAIRTDLKHYVGWLMSQDRQVPLVEIQRPHLALYLQHLQSWTSTRTGRPFRPATINRMFGTVKLLYAYAVEEDYIAKNPSSKIKRPSVPDDDEGKPWLNPLELSALFKESAKRPKDHLLVGLLGMMGLRISEATQLDIEFNLRVVGAYEAIFIIGKGSKPATLPLPVPVLRAMHTVVGDRTEGPVLTTRSGQRMDRACAARILDRLARNIELGRHISPHALRRSFATCGLKAGISLRDMQVAMRHTDPGMTARYDRMVQGLDNHAVHRVAGFVAGMAG